MKSVYVIFHLEETGSEIYEQKKKVETDHFLELVNFPREIVTLNVENKFVSCVNVFSKQSENNFIIFFNFFMYFKYCFTSPKTNKILMHRIFCSNSVKMKIGNVWRERRFKICLNEMKKKKNFCSINFYDTVNIFLHSFVRFGDHRSRQKSFRCRHNADIGLVKFRLRCEMRKKQTNEEAPRKKKIKG